MRKLPIKWRCRRLLQLVLVLLCSLAGPSWAESLLFQVTYNGKFGALSIDTERQLVRLDDGTYRLESRASNFLGSLKETSHFAKQGDQWQPLSYSYRRRILGARTTEKIDFDWDKGTATYSHSDKPERNHQHRLAAGILDPALYQLRMQRDLALGNDPLEYRFVKRDRIRHYRIERTPGTALRIDGKNYDTVQVGRADADDDKQTYVWVIPQLVFLIGKIMHVEEDGEAHQMEITGFKLNRSQLEQFFAVAPQQDSVPSEPATP